MVAKGAAVGVAKRFHGVFQGLWFRGMEGLGY